MKALEYFLCPVCGKDHVEERDAQRCCPQFVCPTCGKTHHEQNAAFSCCEITGRRYMCYKCLEWHDAKADAEKCCTDLAMRDDLEDAGQLRLSV